MEMNCDWTPNQLVLVIDRSDLPLDSDIVQFVFEECAKDELQGQHVAHFLILGLSIMFRNVLRFMRDEK